MKKLILTLLVIMILSLTMSIVSSCNIGGIAGGLPSSGGSGNAQHSGTIYESDGKFEDEGGDIGKNSEKFPDSEKENEKFPDGEKESEITEPDLRGLDYRVNDDGITCTISGLGFCTDNEIIIPSKSPKGHIVTKISQDAFNGCNELTSITIPDSITSIGANAFKGCNNLKKIYITNLAAWCNISGLNNLMGSSIFIIDGLNSNKKLFLNNNLITDLVIPDGVTSINESAFYGCSELTSITIPDSVTSIDCGAFYGCSGLTSITIPDSVTSIGWRAFENCGKLVEIINNSSLNITKGSSENGCIAYYALNVKKDGNSDIANQDGYLFYNYNNTNYLLGYIGNDNDLTLPESYNGNNYEIYEYAFSNCSGLETITVGINNVNYYSEGNCLIETKSKTLIVGCKNSIIPIDGSVTSIGNYAFHGCSGLATITIPDSVTSIGSSAFKDCSGLTSITIGNGVTSIGDSAFYGCSGLTSVKYLGDIESWCKISFKYGDSNPTTFAHKLLMNGEEVKELVIPDSITTLKDYVFSGCSGLTSITIPNSVTSIDDDAFYGCSGLESISVSSKNTEYHSDGNCLIDTKNKKLILGCKNSIIPTDGSVTSIGNNAFRGCSELASIIIPDSVTSIGNYTFIGCSGLTSITLGNGVTSIGNLAFGDCYKLIEVINNSSLNITRFPSFGNIATYAQKIKKGEKSDIVNQDGYLFYNYNNVNYLLGYIGNDNNLTLPESYNGNDYEIYEYAFYGCSGLTSITIPDSVTSIGWNAFYGCSGLTSITIGNGVTSISSGAFIGCSGLTSITIPDSVTYIGFYAFEDCSGLTSIKISNRNTSIYEGAFRGCSKLTSITIPYIVDSIGEGSFWLCTELKKVYYQGTSEQWYNIWIEDYNSNLTSATRYYYSETNPTTNGNFWHYDENGNVVEW